MKNLAILFIMLIPLFVFADELRITTWNIETLGAQEGRGFAGGFGQGKLQLRTEQQVQAIANLIKHELKSDILAVQEILVTHNLEDGTSRNFQLDKVIDILGDGWEYYLPLSQSADDGETMFLGFIWNGNKFDSVNISPMSFVNQKMAGKSLFDRIPLMAYFDVKHPDGDGNDFVLVNVHLASGQHHDENHLIAMTLIEHQLSRDLLKNGIKESDRIILGDFNDNPYAKNTSGSPTYSSALYEHMRFKKYKNFVTKDSGATRMNLKLTSTIDHILANNSAVRHITSEAASIHRPSEGKTAFPKWRRIYSDHFPITISLKTSSSDDDVDYQ